MTKGRFFKTEKFKQFKQFRQTKKCKQIIENDKDSMALCNACAGGFIKVIKTLYSAGANIRYQEGVPISQAACYGKTEVVKLLFYLGIGEQENDELMIRESYREAIKYGHEETALVLMHRVGLYYVDEEIHNEALAFLNHFSKRRR